MKAPIRTLILLVVAMLPGMAMAAEQAKKPAPAPKPVTANPCAQYGPGFVQVQGTNTCVRIGGSVRTDIGR